MTNAAWERIAEEEANALVKLLEGPTRRVHVLITSIDDKAITITRGVSGGTIGSDAYAFVQALERERVRLLSKMVKPS